MKPRYKILVSKSKNFFYPENYPGSVKKSYYGYMKNNFLMQFASSSLGVVSTQQLLLALGAGSLTASAALNWIIKDGVGQLGSVVYAGSVGKKFDENPKFYKWVSTLSLNISCGIEVLAPMFPGYFLLLASIATVGKNISAISGSASRAAIHLNFCKENNLADLTAKSGTQTTLACLIGTSLGTLAAYVFDSYLFGVMYFTGFSVANLICCYRGIMCITLNTLSPQRLDLVLQGFLKSGKILDPEQVSSMEKFFFPYKPQGVVIGSAEVHKEYEDFKSFLIAHDKNSGKVHLTFHENAGSHDIIEGYIKARAVLWGKNCELVKISDIQEKGWDTERNFLSPNSVRFKFEENHDKNNEISR